MLELNNISQHFSMCSTYFTKHQTSQPHFRISYNGRLRRIKARISWGSLHQILV